MDTMAKAEVPIRNGNRVSQFPSIPNLELLGLFKKFPDRGILPPLEHQDAILRSVSELSTAEREVIATYVSTPNDCPFIDARLHPVLAYVRRLGPNRNGRG